MGPFRARFLLECVHGLRSNLESMGSKLFVRLGHPEEILPSIAKHIGASEVICQEEATPQEFQVQLPASFQCISTMASGSETRYAGIGGHRHPIQIRMGIDIAPD